MTMPQTLVADSEAANELAIAHLYLVQHIVNQVSARFPRHIDRQELWNAGAYGLVDASRRYDASSGIPFSRYAAIRIRGAMIDSTRTRDWASRGLRRELREVKRASESFEAAHGREPSVEELAGILGAAAARRRARPCSTWTSRWPRARRRRRWATASPTATAATTPTR
jgi:RNA polymerase sigma factor for flagellar operon FliA